MRGMTQFNFFLSVNEIPKFEEANKTLYGE